MFSQVNDYTIFIQYWTEPEGGIHGYLSRFLASGDPTFQHIAIWTLLQLLESGDKRLGNLISRAKDVLVMVKMIADRSLGEVNGADGADTPTTETGGEGEGDENGDGVMGQEGISGSNGGDDDDDDDDGSEDGERDVIALAQRSLELLGYGGMRRT
ncbi:Vacuolar protein 8 [Ascosphaera aggregata]|nr:Vacuolar protein 8 [Ascosphaera aggregata]